MRLLSTFLQWVLLFGLLNVAHAAQPDSTPHLRLAPGMHFAAIKRVAIDASERFVVTASEDKTARVWDAKNGRLLNTLRPPISEGNEGKLFAIAISPDGQWVAVGGWTGRQWQGSHTVYIFNRQSGQIQTRLTNLPHVINDLAFSPDGRYLAAALGGKQGVRLYQVHQWKEIGRDSHYADQSYSVSFSKRGQLISTSLDGNVYLYSSKGHLRLLHKQLTQLGQRPFFARFSPNGHEIAIGFDDTTGVAIRSAKDLRFIREINTQGIDNGDLSKVAWSRQGRYLYAAGQYANGRGRPIVRWQQDGKGPRRIVAASQAPVVGMLPLRGGELIYATAGPSLARLNAQGNVIWKNTAGNLNYRGDNALRDFALSADGSAVQFRYQQETRGGNVTHGYTSWGLQQQALKVSGRWQKPRHYHPTLNVTAWKNSYKPMLNGQALPLEPLEKSESLAISRSGQFALGTIWYLRLFNPNGSQRWQQAVPAAWAVNISADKRWVVAALGDGTIRWYALNDGKEHLAFYLHTDEKRWIAWTPEGFYTASPGADELMGYHLNKGIDKAAELVKVDRLQTVYERADLVVNALSNHFTSVASATLKRQGSARQLLRSDRLPPQVELVGEPEQTVQGSTFQLKLKLTNQGGGIGRIEYRINGKVVSDASITRGLTAHRIGESNGIQRSFTMPNGKSIVEVAVYGIDGKVASEPVKLTVNVNDPVKQRPSLYVLSLGVTDYLDDSLDLKYAASDATAFTNTLIEHTGSAMYQRIEKKVLLDKDVTLDKIRQAINDFSSRVKAQDVFVLYLAGHGMNFDGRYHFLPYNLRYTNSTAARKQSLSDSKLRDWMSVIKAQKNLLVLDTCNAGAVATNLAKDQGNTMTLAMARGGSALEDKVAISNLMDATGFVVLAASSDKQQALEGIVDKQTQQGHGLFTHAVLNGIRGAADTSGDRRVSIRELERYVNDEVPRLSLSEWQFKQVPMSFVQGSDFPVARHK